MKKLDDFTESFFIGHSTLDKVEEYILSEISLGNKDLDINCSNPKLIIQPSYIETLADIEDKYKMKFIGLGDKEEAIETIKNSGYFIKKNLSEHLYALKFKEVIQSSDFPLLIQDNRQSGENLIKFNIIQPIGFDDSFFIYIKFKSSILDLKKFEDICWNIESPIGTVEKIHISDIGNKSKGFRFPNSKKEKTILDIYSNILEGSMSFKK